MSPKPAALLALQRTGYAKFIGWRKELFPYDSEVRLHSQTIGVEDMHWCDNNTPTADSLTKYMLEQQPDGIVMVDTAYYKDYNEALGQAVVKLGTNPHIVSVHNYYSTDNTSTYHDVISNKPAVTWN